MIRMANLYSGDSAAWKKHASFGVADLIRDETFVGITRKGTMIGDPNYTKPAIENVVFTDTVVTEERRPRYQQYHIARGKNDFDRIERTDLIDNPRHFTKLPDVEQRWVCDQVEKHVPFLLAQYDANALALVNIAELQAFAESRPWNVSTLQVKLEYVLNGELKTIFLKTLLST